MRSRSLPSFTAILLNIQYTVGYVAAGFLISVPIQLLWTIYQTDSPGKWSELWGSLERGLLSLGVYFVLWPILRYYDWGGMKLPEFKLFELSVTRNATLVSLGLLLISFFDPRIGSRQMLWLLFLLEGVAYVKLKAHTLIFRDFYTLERKAHEQQWYDQLTAEIREQAREVQGRIRGRIARLAQWIARLRRKKPSAQPEAKPMPVLTPMPCRYQGRSLPGRIFVLPVTPHKSSPPPPQGQDPRP